MVALTLKQAIDAGSIIAGQRDERETQKKEGGREEDDLLVQRLTRRLDAFHQTIESQWANTAHDLASLQSATGIAALQAVELINQAALAKKSEEASTSAADHPTPLFGSRDLQTLKLLLAIASNWCLGALVIGYDESLGNVYQGRSSHETPKLQEVEEEEKLAKKEQDQVILFVQARSNLAETLDRCSQLTSASSTVAGLILEACSLHLLAACIRLGWGPVDPSTRGVPDDRSRKATSLTSGLLKRLPTNASLKLLSGVGRVGKGDNHSRFRFIKSTTEMLFSAQLLRRDGVMALLGNTFNVHDTHDRGLMKKLVSVGQLLSTPPPRMAADTFATAIVPRLLEVVGERPATTVAEPSQQPNYSLQSTPAQKNAATFALARLYEVAPTAVESVLYSELFRFICPKGEQETPEEDSLISSGEQLASAIGLIMEIVNQSEPSSSLIVGLLTPIVVPLFGIYCFSADEASKPNKIVTIESKKKQKANQQIGSLAGSLFTTWLRLCGDIDEALSRLSPQSNTGLFGLEGKKPGALLSGTCDERKLEPVLENEDDCLVIRWKVAKKEGSNIEALSKMDLRGLDVRLQDDDEVLPDAIPTELLAALDQSPSPSRLALLIKQSERKDVASALLVDLLQAYTLAKQSDIDDLKDVLYMQHIAQLVEQLGSDILQDQPEKILSFIAFALGQRPHDEGKEKVAETPKDEEMPFITAKKEASSALGDLLNVRKDAEQVEGEDTLMHRVENEEEDEELTETALSLLLSLLEGDRSMTPHTHSLLKVITHAVSRLTDHSNSSIRSLAKEAQLVLTARQSVTLDEKENADSVLMTSRQRALKNGQAMYHEALRLLQDPIVPVRAHGLVMLKELVAFGSEDETKGTLMDPALTPAILDIFVQIVCDDESFLYLNAIKGLAEMGNSGGRLMIRKLMSLYVGPANATPMTQAEVDKRLRLGEALLQVVQKLELALAPYTDDIVAPLLAAVRNAELSATLRSSMLSILGTCIEACPKAMAHKGYANAIGEAMLDLLRVENDLSKPNTTANQPHADDALSTDAKIPHFRRAALLLLSLLVRGATMQLQEEDEKRQEAGWHDDGAPKISALRMPGGNQLKTLSTTNPSASDQSWKQELLFRPEKVKPTEIVVGYVSRMDNDALVCHQASQVMEDIETYKLYAIQRGGLEL